MSLVDLCGDLVVSNGPSFKVPPSLGPTSSFKHLPLSPKQRCELQCPRPPVIPQGFEIRPQLCFCCREGSGSVQKQNNGELHGQMKMETGS